MGRNRDSTPFPQRARSLSLRQRGEHVTAAGAPIPVRAWILTVAGEEFEVEALALEWTHRAVHITYADRHERADWAWVWAGAVTRR